MKFKVACRKVYDYIRYDLKEIAFPSSLPDPPHIKKRPKLTLKEWYYVRLLPSCISEYEVYIHMISLFSICDNHCIKSGLQLSIIAAVLESAWAPLSRRWRDPCGGMSV